jgi:hypothetical protein
MVNAVCPAYVPAPAFSVSADTGGRLTVAVRPALPPAGAAPTRVVQALAVTVPLKLMVPSAAFALADNPPQSRMRKLSLYIKYFFAYRSLYYIIMNNIHPVTDDVEMAVL